MPIYGLNHRQESLGSPEPSQQGTRRTMEWNQISCNGWMWITSCQRPRNRKMQTKYKNRWWKLLRRDEKPKARRSQKGM